MECDSCNNYVWDEEDEEYYCVADIDEDDYARLMEDGHHRTQCPFWQSNDEYAVVRHQAFGKHGI